VILAAGHVQEAIVEGSALPRRRGGFFSEGAGQAAMDDLYKDLLRFGCLKVSNAVRNLSVSSGFPRSMDGVGMEIQETITCAWSTSFWAEFGPRKVNKWIKTHRGAGMLI
jgi:hypothetical protein